MTVALRHRCRYCRSKLAEPTDNPRRGFCCRGCFNSFYRSRCVVCERDLRADPVSGERRNLAKSHRRYCGRKCKAEAAKYPETYGEYVSSLASVKNPHEMGIKFGLAGHPPSRMALRHWWWGDPGIGDCSLYDAEGLTRARIVRVAVGWVLRTPVVVARDERPARGFPPRFWDDMAQARAAAEDIALISLGVDPKLAAAFARDNKRPPSLPRSSAGDNFASRGADVPSKWRPTGEGRDMPDIPPFLRKAA